VAGIEAEEAAVRVRRAVAGYDYTFSVPKSVSVLWALADAGTKSRIVAAHHAAVTDVLGLMEREVAATRTGATGPDGAVAQVEVGGLVATGFDHYDSRAGDPQLHTHVVVSNKVRTLVDRKWRALDGRPMHAAVVALSEQYNAVLADRLTATLGVGWGQRDRGRDRNPAWEITGVPEQLISLFSSRSHAIETETDQLIDSYIARHGHRPSTATILKLRAQATLATRPDKTLRSLAELTTGWRERASGALGRDSGSWAAGLLTGTDQPLLLRAEDVPVGMLDAFGHSVVEAVAEKRSTWTTWNLHAEASRQTMGLRFATTADREAVVGLVVDAALGASLRLTPPEFASSPAEFQRAEGTSVFRPRHATVYTSAELLVAEDRLLELARTSTAPAVEPGVIDREAGRPDPEGRVLGEDQAAAVAAVATSGRAVDVLVGPAGAGKTTAMNALRRAWEARHGAGSVIGLAPSAAAAEVLGDDLGIATENTAKWLHDHDSTGAQLTSGQAVIIDEASLAGTRTLDRITTHAAQVGAKVLLVGDWAQLAAVDAGGAFGLLVRDRPDPPELSDVRRFAHPWERDATVRLRTGDPTVIDTYQAHDRISGGDTAAMVDAAYQAWLADLAAGRSSVMIAATTDTVTALNTTARLDRVTAGQVAATGAVRLHDGTDASAGDLVVTRRNDRRIASGRRWVRNGDRWTVTATHHDGTLTVRRAGPSGGSVTLAASYVAEHVELGYAVTAHRAQGSTTDTAHAVVAPSMTRETLYVAMTRGRHANNAYVVTDEPADEDHHHSPDEVTARSVLLGVLNRSGTELSAHETIEAEQQRWAGIAQLGAEYETLAATAQHHRWVNLVEGCGLTARQAAAVIASDAFGPLCAELRRAEANHHNPQALLARLVAAQGFSDARDLASVLHHRLADAVQHRPSRTRRAPRLIAGLIPPATGPMNDDLRQALNERDQLIEQRARALAVTALTSNEPWTRHLGPEPARDPQRRAAWLRFAETVAAYRDRYHITTPGPLSPPETAAQAADTARARAALANAQRLATPDRAHTRRRPTARTRNEPSL
jgi:conjugative relaxase-like TrwC/TraI family protein